MSFDPVARGLGARALSGGRTNYLGVVATRGAMQTAINAGETKSGSRSMHIARDTITSLQVVFANWYLNSSHVETNAGASATLTASVEYPVGTFTQIKFSGSASVSQANGATTVSDSVSVSIPRGGVFYIRTYRVCSAGVLYHNLGNWTPDGFDLGSSVTDNTMGGSYTIGGGNNYYPAAIIAQTQRPSVLMLGDSMTMGSWDSSDDNTGDMGLLARSIGPWFGYINLGNGGDQANLFAASNAKRAALAAYVSHVLINLGRNDIASAGRTGAQALADLATITALFPTKTVYLSTVAPSTTTTDSWATVANQTTYASNAERLVFNRAIRCVPAGCAGYFDIANTIESSPDSGKFATLPSGSSGAASAATGDGVHPNQLGYLRIKTSGVINPALFAR